MSSKAAKQGRTANDTRYHVGVNWCSETEERKHKIAQVAYGESETETTFLAMCLLVACVLGEDHVRAEEKLAAVL